MGGKNELRTDEAGLSSVERRQPSKAKDSTKVKGEKGKQKWLYLYETNEEMPVSRKGNLPTRDACSRKRRTEGAERGRNSLVRLSTSVDRSAHSRFCRRREEKKGKKKNRRRHWDVMLKALTPKGLSTRRQEERASLLLEGSRERTAAPGRSSPKKRQRSGGSLAISR